MNYLEIIKNVLANGTPKVPTRVDNNGNVTNLDNNTIGTFCEVFRHDMSKGFPLTTLRKMPWKSIRVELEGFIKGVTDKKWFQDRGCKFWDEWANPIKSKELIGKEIPLDLIWADSKNVYSVDLDGNKTKECFDVIETQKQAQLFEYDLGPIYGYQWRNFAKQYGEVKYSDFIEGGCCPATGTYQQIEENVNGLYNGVDQLKSIVDKLHNSPCDRRMVCSAWNPNQMDQMALPPCHWGFNVVVYGGRLNLVWHQRSCDLLLGVGANIASYGLLLLLLAEEAGLKPGELVGTLADCHIYCNLLNNASELVKREENTLPTVKIKRKGDGSFSIFDWTWDDVELIGYDPHPAIDMGSVTV